MWERVGFYTLMAILVLYMDNVLKWSDSRKGDWYAAIAFGSYGSGLLGKFYSRFPPHQYFLLLAGLLALAAVMVGFFIKKLERYAG
ncbi:MAG: hypothetical protein H5U06_03685 [Candidatus Aminicenantes bacterium]|nr:hypothetical protein [Candidatus Aminicenantes bacterium]